MTSTQPHAHAGTTEQADQAASAIVQVLDENDTTVIDPAGDGTALVIRFDHLNDLADIAPDMGHEGADQLATAAIHYLDQLHRVADIDLRTQLYLDLTGYLDDDQVPARHDNPDWLPETPSFRA